MSSDLDAQAGELTIEKMKETLKDMGLDSSLKIKENKLTPGTLEIEGDFDLCVHKTGVKAKVGDAFHQSLNAVDAKNPEIYLSERMRDRTRGTKNVGTDYVEVQDHLKKARKGHITPAKELIADQKLLQKMAKGTSKTLDMGYLNDDDLSKILKKNKIDETPAQFREKMAQIKEGDYQVKTSGEASKIRETSKDIFSKTDLKTRIQAAQEFKVKREELHQLRKKIKTIDAMADKPELRARKESLKKSLQAKEFAIREELIDSKVKMEASKTANDEFFSDPHQTNTHKKSIPDATPPRKTAPLSGSSESVKTKISPNDGGHTKGKKHHLQTLKSLEEADSKTQRLRE